MLGLKRRWAGGLQAGLAVMLFWVAPEQGWAQADTTASDVRIVGTMRDSASKSAPSYADPTWTPPDPVP